MKRSTILPLLGASALLTACGYREDLQRPPPMWGEPQVEQAAQDHEDAAKAPAPPAPQTHRR